MCHSHAIEFTVDPSLRIQFSRLIPQDHLRGVRDVGVDMINMKTDSIVTSGVECPLLPQGVGLIPLGNKTTDASTVLGEELRSTPGNQALMRDPLSCKVWSTGTELTEKAMTEMCPPAAEFMFQDQSVLAEPSEPQ